MTWFKCGGMSFGLSWAHVLGDAFSAVDFINKWGQVLATIRACGQPSLPKLSPTRPSLRIQKSGISPKPANPISVKRVDPVGDHWVTANNCKMDTFSFHLTSTQVSHLQSKIKDPHQIPAFESLCAIIWQCIAKIRHGFGPNIVTVCRKGSENGKLASNIQIVSAFEADFSVGEVDLEKLAEVLCEKAGMDERSLIEEAMEKENGVMDLVFYGASLTFVNWEEANVYGLELNGEKADFGSYTIQGVGDEGTVIVLPGAKDSDKARFVTIILPEDQLLKLKPELRMNGLLLETNL